MIGRLTGKILEKSPDGKVILDVGGVGFEVQVPTSSIPKLPASPGETTLHVQLIAREDSIALYGFETRAHLVVFKLLIQVKNIGPKHAMSILSTLKPEEIAAELHRENVEKFKSVPGIGKKTAEMIIVELRDKIRKTRLEMVPEEPPLGERLQEVAAALLHLGFRSQEVQEAVRGLKELDGKGAGVEEMIREALSKITR